LDQLVLTIPQNQSCGFGGHSELKDGFLCNAAQIPLVEASVWNLVGLELDKLKTLELGKSKTRLTKQLPHAIG
jgi:hypothetical protein